MNKQNMRYIFLIGLLPVASAFAETAVQCHNLEDDALRFARENSVDSPEIGNWEYLKFY